MVLWWWAIWRNVTGSRLVHVRRHKLRISLNCRILVDSSSWLRCTGETWLDMARVNRRSLVLMWCNSVILRRSLVSWDTVRGRETWVLHMLWLSLRIIIWLPTISWSRWLWISRHWRLLWKMFFIIFLLSGSSSHFSGRLFSSIFRKNNSLTLRCTRSFGR